MTKRLALVVCCLVTWIPGAARAQTQEIQEIPSIRSLFLDVPHDLANVIQPQTVLILGLGGGASASVHPADVQLTRDAAKTTTLENVLDPGQVIGGAYFQIGGAVATYLTGRLTHSSRIATLGGELVRAQIVNAVLTEPLKLSVRRRRPDGTPLSFPSGHSSGTFATATVLQREFGWKVGAPAYALATYVAISRMSENKHYASDIAFGAAIGIVAGRSVRFHTGQHDLALSPMAAPGGAGVSVSWVTRH